MLRRLSTAAAVVALVCGFSAAPYTHAHRAIDSASDEHHPHGDSLVHAHVSPHAHDDAADPEPADKDDSEDQIWSVDSFVFQQVVLNHAPAPALQVFGEPHVRPTGIWLNADRLQANAHGPPVGSPSGLRAPPAFLPAFA